MRPSESGRVGGARKPSGFVVIGVATGRRRAGLVRAGVGAEAAGGRRLGVGGATAGRARNPPARSWAASSASTRLPRARVAGTPSEVRGPRGRVGLLQSGGEDGLVGHGKPRARV